MKLVTQNWRWRETGSDEEPNYNGERYGLFIPSPRAHRTVTHIQHTREPYQQSQIDICISFCMLSVTNPLNPFSLHQIHERMYVMASVTVMVK